MALENQQTPAQTEIIAELQNQIGFLDDKIDKLSTELRGKLDERHSAMRDLLISQVKAIEKISLDNRKHQNRNFFNLGLLLILLGFITGAIVNSSMERVESYMMQHLDNLRIEVEQFMTDKEKDKENSSFPK